MRKSVFRLDDEILDMRRRSRWPLVLVVLFLLVGIGPLVLEGGALCVANWKEYMGVSADTRTPYMDSLHDNLSDLSNSCWQLVTPYIVVLPWRPKLVLPIAGVVMSLAMLMLRR